MTRYEELNQARSDTHRARETLPGGGVRLAEHVIDRINVFFGCPPGKEIRPAPGQLSVGCLEIPAVVRLLLPMQVGPDIAILMAISRSGMIPGEESGDEPGTKSAFSLSLEYEDRILSRESAVLDVDPDRIDDDGLTFIFQELHEELLEAVKLGY